ncbi:disease resistance protein RGA3 [Canna indica]|uniref:Disease resistance protein RGA3 n=1 Tax=Canna indica TaxID=4628 RepID=A0AAQ3Q231_9LILI|nr:disease resistance protein RGA3 [Canna indica]
MRKDMPCGIGQLNELVNLTGLAISGLENLSIEEAKEVNLKGMHGLNHLFLEWHNVVRYYNKRSLVSILKFDNNIYDTDSDHRNKCLNVNLKSRNILVDEEMMTKALQSLHPHSNLKDLHLCGFNGVRYPSWMDDPLFNQLTEVSLYKCGNKEISCLPMFGQLPSLQRLYLLRISHVKSIGDEFCCCNPNVLEF